MPETIGGLLKRKRIERQLVQEEVAGVLGITRQRLSQIESGKADIVLDPERAGKVSRLLKIEMFDLVMAMGYQLRLPGSLSADEASLLENYRRLTPAQQRVIRAAVSPE
jgi:transcriptional regulator with XRE-family HTH domain